MHTPPGPVQKPDRQSPSTLQVLVQAFAAHWNGVQSCAVTLQLPA
jgi:hypothetical protein